MEQDQASWFELAKRVHLRRFGLLGIEGNQPAIRAFVETTSEEKKILTRNILLQKLSTNAKATKEFDELVRRREQGEQASDERMLTKYARVAMGATVKWVRAIASTVDEDCDQQEGRQEAQEGRDKCELRVTGYSRMLSCLRCNEPQETKRMQLRTTLGVQSNPLWGVQNTAKS